MSMSENDRVALLSLARRAVEAYVKGEPTPKVEIAAGLLAETRGCFVTLTNCGRLRGCIGTFQPTAPLGETLIEMGRAAARDPRFVTDPITPAELDELTVEVSVLSPLEKTDNPEALEIGKHGVYIVSAGRSGCFLPEVADDQGWDAEEFLSYCCAHKAGLAGDAWKSPETTVYLFTTEKISEER
jgi:AmmeMemoRadiSam system protein A